MSTILPFDPIQHRDLVIEPPMTDLELEEFCRLNDAGQIERTKEGVIRMNAPAGFDTSDGNAEIGLQLRAWWKTHRRGRVGDSSSGFFLADGSLLSPDAAYLSDATLAGVSREDLKGFPHLCPDFVIELLSETDRLSELKQKMELWIENGVQLAWLVNPRKQQVLVYQSGKPLPSVAQAEWVEGSGPVEGFRLNLAEVWDCY